MPSKSALKSVSNGLPQGSFDPNKYSAEHGPHIGLMEGFLAKVRAQEEMFVAAGFPLEGIADFMTGWFAAWEQRSVHALREFWADDLVYADPTGGSRDFTMTRTDMDVYTLLFKMVPDVVFYPQDDTPRALPYYDFLDGTVRITVPWRVLARPPFVPRVIDAVGVDRYNMIRDPERGWLITRIDTDADALGLIGQVLPIAIRYPTQKMQHRVFKFTQRFIPALRVPQVRPFAGEL